jgi:two-component system NtrC family sensor kinase
MDEQVKILFVDDERNVLRALERLFLDDEYEIITALSGEEGLHLLKSEQPVQIVISDYRMPGMNGVEFLREVCRSWPDTVRIVLSGYADTAAVVNAINEGEIFRFIPKPWNNNELKMTIVNALEHYCLQQYNSELMKRLAESNAKLQAMNENLETLPTGS